MSRTYTHNYKIAQFGKAGVYDPVPGDIVFLDFDDGKADHVGIVTGMEGNTLKTIEGNRSPKAEERVPIPIAKP